MFPLWSVLLTEAVQDIIVLKGIFPIVSIYVDICKTADGITDPAKHMFEKILVHHH